MLINMTDFEKLIDIFENALQRCDTKTLEQSIDEIEGEDEYKRKHKFTQRGYKLLSRYYAYRLGIQPDLSGSKEEIKNRMRGLCSMWLSQQCIQERDDDMATYADNAELCRLLKLFYRAKLQHVEHKARGSLTWYSKESTALYDKMDYHREEIYHLVLKSHLKQLIPGREYYECTHPLMKLMDIGIYLKYRISHPKYIPLIPPKSFD